MAGSRNFLGSLVGKKLIVAFTGLILLLFLLGHVTGNLKALFGADPNGIPAIDTYGKFLRTMGEPIVPYGALLWAARTVLLSSLVVHVVVVFQLTAANRTARPIQYSQYRTRASSFAAKSMMFTGVAILVFIALHVLHLTTGTIRFGAFEHGRVYANLYYSFRQPVVALVYMAMMLAVGLHILHGSWSFFQTWGIDNPDRNWMLRRSAVVIALAITIGFSLLPLLFMFGILPEPSALMSAPVGTKG